MRLRVMVPSIETNLPRAAVERWHVQPGDRCEFGQPICDLAVSERIRIKSVGRADALIKVTRRKKKVEDVNETEQGRFHVVYQVLASEPATIVSLAADLGTELEVGDLLAIADSDPSPAPAGGEGDAGAPAMRVVAALAPEESF